MFQYHVNADSQVPIYRQLVDQINAQIRSGALKTGTQLPTVREMAEKLRLSCGTVKKVYDCLQEMGDIEMTRRRGTFVKYVHRDQDSRKYQAMVAIDQMIRKLTELNFSPAEIQIFLNLKMREWGLKWTGLRVTLVTEYPELTQMLEKQLKSMANVQISVYPLRQLQEYPYSVDEQSDVILADYQDAQKIAHLLPDAQKLVQVAFAADGSSLLSIANARGESAGVVCETAAFARLVQEKTGLGRRVVPLHGEDAEFDKVDFLIVAEDHLEKCSPQMRAKIDAFAREKKVCTFVCHLDEGSMLHLNERIGKMRDERQQWPAALRI